MSTYPEGNFTIVNNETGRCVRVRLGRTTDVSDWKEGTKYLQYVTDKPGLELGEPDGSPATVWWFSTIDDTAERQPFSQIVSHAVGEYQNIGDYCVWLDLNPYPTAEDRQRAADLFRHKLDDMPWSLKEKLAVLLPAGFKTWAEAEVGADASLAKQLELWHGYCASIRFPEHHVEEDPEGVDAAHAYIDAAAEQGIHPPAVESGDASTRMHGCGARREKNSTYRWAYDGTHIYAADSKTVPAERTYWTDEGGFLVGKSKGGPGQTWTLAPWKPPIAQTQHDPVKALALTGLFGPFASLFGN
ncbi:hypothetical protein [Streptomyces sp. NPDC059957]|uniref:hypothetical protein n=1 Tax=Streptomyces sp. NPDC059957 TaxID=3347016 RepID=UPI0036521676